MPAAHSWVLDAQVATTVRRKLRFVSGVTGLAAEGERQLSGVKVTRGTRSETIPCDTLLLHQGVIPSVNLASAANCVLDFDTLQRTPKASALWYAEVARSGRVTLD